MRKHQDCHTLLRLHFFEKLDRSDLFWLLPGSSCTSSGFIPGDSNGFFVSLCNSHKPILQWKHSKVTKSWFKQSSTSSLEPKMMGTRWCTDTGGISITRLVPEIIPMDAQEVRQRYPDTYIILCIWRKGCVCVCMYVCTYVRTYVCNVCTYVRTYVRM